MIIKTLAIPGQILISQWINVGSGLVSLVQECHVLDQDPPSRAGWRSWWIRSSCCSHFERFQLGVRNECGPVSEWRWPQEQQVQEGDSFSASRQDSDPFSKLQTKNHFAPEFEAVCRFLKFYQYSSKPGIVMYPRLRVIHWRLNFCQHPFSWYS